MPVKDLVLDFHQLCERSRDQLVWAFSEEEVWEAVRTADGGRAPRPDGFNLAFYQRYWNC